MAWHDVFWIAGGVAALAAAGMIAMNIKETKLGMNSSRLVALLFAAVAYYGLIQISELWPIPNLKFGWLQYAIPLGGVAAIIFFVICKWHGLKSEVGDLLWSSSPFFGIAVLAVFARYCFS
jgi:hypothetical protein